VPWTWSGQTPRGTGPQKYPVLVRLLWSHRVGWPREVPSICGATVGVHPWLITLEGRSVRKGVAPYRDQAADAVSDTLDELPARCPRCDPSPIANCTAARQTAADLHVEVRSVCRCLSSVVGLRWPGNGLGCR
jgi:hypothetical protein